MADEIQAPPSPATLLAIAAAIGALPTVKRILSEGVDANARQSGGLTAMHRACYSGNLDVAKTLFDFGADVNLTDFSGWTPMRYAKRSPHHDVVAWLESVGGRTTK